MKPYRLFFTVTFFLLAISAYSQKLESGNVVGIWEFELTLQESMTFEQFEKLYIEEYIPAIKSNFPGTEIYLMKGERGKRTGKYIEFIVFDSVEERNKWFPEPGNSSEAAKQAFNNMREIQSRISKMGSEATFTDYIVY